MFKFLYRLATSRQTAVVEMPKKVTVTAADLEEFMRILAVLRASMEPAVPNEDLKPTDLFSIVPAIRWFVGPDPDAPTQVRLYLRHLGFGWIWIPMTLDGCAKLTDQLQKQLQARPPLQ